jgi:hypothetical protein
MALAVPPEASVIGVLRLVACVTTSPVGVTTPIS